jgi:organic hydroperoxide reductase OsmC/OhrA
MNPTHYDYQVDVEWGAERHGSVRALGRPEIAVGAPPEFQGTDDVWSPEHLTLAAVNSCMMLTFIAIAANSKLSFEGYAASAHGRLEKVEGRGMVFTSIVVRARVTVRPDADRSRLERVLRMTEKNCFVSNSMTAAVTLEAEIETA